MSFTIRAGYHPTTIAERRAYLRLVGAYDCRFNKGPDCLAQHFWGMSDLDVNRLFLAALPPVSAGAEGAHEMLHALRMLAHVHPHFTPMLVSVMRRAKEKSKGQHTR